MSALPHACPCAKCRCAHTVPLSGSAWLGSAGGGLFKAWLSSEPGLWQERGGRAGRCSYQLMGLGGGGQGGRGCAGSWPTDPKALAAQQVTERLPAGSVGGDWEIAPPEEASRGEGRTVDVAGSFLQPSVSPSAFLCVLRHLLPKATRSVVLRLLKGRLSVLCFAPLLGGPGAAPRAVGGALCSGSGNCTHFGACKTQG